MGKLLVQNETHHTHVYSRKLFSLFMSVSTEIRTNIYIKNE